MQYPFNLDPSQAAMWGPGGCPASARMQHQYPGDATSPARADGQAACWYMTETLLGRVVTVGQLAPGGSVVTQEMIDCAADILRDIVDTKKGAAGPVTLKVEEPLDASDTVHPANKGRPDVYLIDWGRPAVHVWEYKFGHRYVDAFQNWQCVNYLAMALECNGVDPSDWPNWSCTVTIAQPRNYHPDGQLREWHFNGAQLAELVSRLRAAAHLAMVDAPMFMTGDHCRDCSGRHACAALQRATMRLVDFAYDGQPVDLPADALGLELRYIRDAIKRLGARAEGLEEHALALAKAGASIPHWRAEYSKGRERWREDVSTEEILALGQLFDADLAQPVKPITPGQARKAGVDPEAIKGFAHTPRGGLTLVPFDETDVARRFGS